jgi:voltage-gated potassium channel
MALAILAAIYVGGAAGYYLLGEGRWTWSDCFYMTAITISTVGYGETIPIGNDPLLRGYTIVLIFVGAMSIVYVGSNITAFLVEGDLNQYLRRRRMDKEIGKVSGHYIVCGVGRNGERAASRLIAFGRPVVLVDRSEERLKGFAEEEERRVPYVIGDATDEHVLRRAGIERAAGLVAALPEDQDNIYLILSARELNPKARIVSRLNEERSRKKFVQVGADSVVSPSAMGGLRMFSELVRPGVMSFLDYVLHEGETDLSIEEVPIGEGSAVDGKRLDQSGIRQKTNLLVVGVRDPGSGRFTYNPGPDLELAAGMRLIVLGPTAAISELRRMTG